MNQGTLAAQPIPDVVISIAADDSGKVEVAQPALSQITRNFA